jgi:hypothetical protein
MGARCWLAVVACATILLGIVPPEAAPGAGLIPFGLFVFSDLCIAPNSGDVEGHRISLLRFFDSDKLIYEYTEGALMWPLFAEKKGGSTCGRVLLLSKFTAMSKPSCSVER